MIDQVVELSLTRDNLTLVATPDALHRHMTSFLPDLGGRSSSIRADTQTLFRVDLPTEPLGKPGSILLRLRGDAVVAPGAQAHEVAPLTDEARVVVTVAAERRNTEHRGAWCDVRTCRTNAHRTIATRGVRDDEAVDWANELLGRHGFEATDLAVGPARFFGARRAGGARVGKAFRVRDVLATLRIVDQQAAEEALRRGIGRGKSYGLGMIVPLT